MGPSGPNRYHSSDFVGFIYLPDCWSSSQICGIAAPRDAMFVAPLGAEGLSLMKVHPPSSMSEKNGTPWREATLIGIYANLGGGSAEFGTCSSGSRSWENMCSVGMRSGISGRWLNEGNKIEKNLYVGWTMTLVFQKLHQLCLWYRTKRTAFWTHTVKPDTCYHWRA